MISIMAGLLYPDAGTGRICDLDLVRQRRKIRAIVNFASGHANFPDVFTVDETLNDFGMLYGLPGKQRKNKADELTRLFELGPYRRTPFNQLSTGLKQRLALAKSLLNVPRVLFLDEPTVGLDPRVSLQIRSRLRELNQASGTTIILTTHQMDEADQLSDRIAFLKDGEFVRIGKPEELKKSIRSQHEERQVVRYADLPRGFVQAVLAAEDARFFSHAGVDPLAMGRAGLANVRKGRIVQGGSTITQQTVKNLYLGQERTWWRKLRELPMAFILDLRYSKERILQVYVNEVYLGQRGSVAICGAGAASRYFFGRDLGDLDVAEWATLAGLIRNPGGYNPFQHPKRAVERRNQGLGAMGERVYCGGGYRSVLAADALQQMGYTEVLSMDGGIKAWREAGCPLDKGQPA